MTIVNTEPQDIDQVFEIYDQAIAYQQQVKNNNWISFERPLIVKEIAEKRHYKILEGYAMACTFVITESDPLIWKEKNADPAIYIHRIATNPDFRGGYYVKKIVEWAKVYAKKHHKLFIRMDTTSGNDRLNQYYMGCGFTYKGITTVHWTNDLPEHYKHHAFSLFELEV